MIDRETGQWHADSYEDMRRQEDEQDAHDRAWEAYCERVEELQELRMSERDVAPSGGTGVAVTHGKAPEAEMSPAPSVLAYRERIR